LWPVAIKPGRPVGIGDIDACPILALPGNPVAAVVAFVALGRTVVNVLSRAADEPLDEFMLPAGFALEKRQGVRQYLLSNIRLSRGGTALAVPCGKQGTAMLSALAAMDGLIVLEEHCSLVREGDPVAFVPVQAPLS
jgi:molybdopterin molybdotransferase